ncbi:hypothetical protein F5051DRAFT_447458 [Lentinula edodes]|nr:hypothetical protein F5051DRAFT_447458 [Lentinula edodes]
MPRDDPNVPRYKKIEQMAKDLGWDRAESYFANMEDDEDDKVMDQQMNPNVNLAVWMTRIEELSDRLGNLEAHREDDSKPSDSPTPKRFGNVEATPHVGLRTASPLPPPTLEDVHPQAQPPGTYPPWHIPSLELTLSRPICIYDLPDPVLTF